MDNFPFFLCTQTVPSQTTMPQTIHQSQLHFQKDILILVSIILHYICTSSEYSLIVRYPLLKTNKMLQSLCNKKAHSITRVFHNHFNQNYNVYIIHNTYTITLHFSVVRAYMYMCTQLSLSDSIRGSLNLANLATSGTPLPATTLFMFCRSSRAAASPGGVSITSV